MNNDKVGKLIFSLRREKHMTQKELADALHLSDRTISKWERGQGCPDISLLKELSQLLGVDIEKILSGDLEPNDQNGGNMKRVKFYVCPTCGNVLFGIGDAAVSCCGRKLSALKTQDGREEHRVQVEEVENDYYVTIEHEMSKEHFISFAAYVGFDRVLLVKMYPEQNAEVRFPQMQPGKLYLYCNRHGLQEHTIGSRR